jgi:hypothetical protein
MLQLTGSRRSASPRGEQRALANPTHLFVDELPPALVRDIFLHMPADQRARAACVCRAWREALADPALWLRLDLSVSSGVTCRVDGAALRYAAARARGGLEALDITDQSPLCAWAYYYYYAAEGQAQPWAEVRAVCAANASSLRQLRTMHIQGLPDTTDIVAVVEALLSEAPALQAIEANVLSVECVTARRLMCLGPLQVRMLELGYDHEFSAFVAELASYSSLTDLTVCGGDTFPTPAELVSVVDSALARRLPMFSLGGCRLYPIAAPTWVRMLNSTALTYLSVFNGDDDPPLLDMPAAALLSAALRANRTLRELHLSTCGLWSDTQAAVELLGALTGHVSINVLDFSFNYAPPLTAEAVGAALGALVAADAPALEELHLEACSLGDARTGPLMDALAGNTHLRILNLRENDVSDTFARDRLLPAIRANTSLRELNPEDGPCNWEKELEPDAAVEAAKLVRTREAARLAALAAGSAAA